MHVDSLAAQPVFLWGLSGRKQIWRVFSAQALNERVLIL